DRERPPVARARSQLAHDGEQRERLQLRAQRRRPPRTWIACSTPIAARFVIIDEPPTDTNGSGMPVIGAIPIVMPMLTNTWNRNMKTSPPATIAEKRSRAEVTIFSPRQTTSR